MRQGRGAIVADWLGNRDAPGTYDAAYRPWAVIEVCDRGMRCTLSLAYAGREVPVGRLLSDEGRRQLADDLQQVIVRAERPHPGAQLRFTDSDGNRLTAFITNTTRGQLADLELRHRRRARCEDRIRNMKDTGLRNLPLHDLSQNQIWIAVVMLATELTAWMQMLALTGEDARVWEPKRLRLRLFSIAGSIAHHSRRTWLHLSSHAPHVHLITTGLTRLDGLPQVA